MNGHDIAEKAASNAWFTIVGRGAMIASTALAGWLLQSVGNLQTEVKVLTNTVSFTMADRYRSDEAKRDFALRDLRIDALVERMTGLEHEVRSTKIDVKETKQEVEKGLPKRR